MSTPLLILLSTVLINAGLLLLMFSKRDKDMKRKPLVIFSLSIIFLLLWSGFNYLADISNTSQQGLFWTRATFPPALLMGFFILLFSWSFRVEKVIKKSILYVYAALVLTASAIVFTDLGVEGVTVDPSTGVFEVSLGAAYPLVIVLLLALIIRITLNFFSSYCHLKGKYKQQMKLVLIGWSFFLSVAFVVNALLPQMTGDASWGKFGPLSSIVMVSAITYAIVRHELFDIRIIIQRGLVYTLLLLIAALFYAIVLFVLKNFLSRDTEVDAVVGAFITSAIGIISAPTLERFFQKLTDPIFFKGRYDYVKVMSELSQVLNKNIIEGTIIRKTTGILTEAFRTDAVSIYLGSNKFNTQLYEISVPIKNGEQKIGTLCVGQKRSGASYGKEDYSLIHTFASQAGVALEKARLYAEVKDYAKDLEKKVKARTAEIVNLQKEQESMMHEISHGLQTPLTIMKGELFMLRKQGYEVSGIDNIDSSINRISLFINKLLSLYRLERSVVAKPKNIRLLGLVNAVASSFSGMCDGKNISCTVSAKKDYKVKGDYNELEEVLSNLVSNAIKYSRPEKSNHIEITFEGTKREVLIKVSDTGLGIRSEEIKKLFTKFYRVRDADTKYIQGTGLGLVICKKIIEKHGGSIVVESEVGVGTTFIITLPRVKAESRK